MKLHWSPRSPFVRKVMIAAHETALIGRLDCVRTVVGMTRISDALRGDNPLNKIPTLVLDDGSVLYDSAVICEYLDTLHDGPKLFPPVGAKRFTALRRQALGDGFLDMLVLWRNERDRPMESQSLAHITAYKAKSLATLTALDEEAGALGATPFDIGHIPIGIALAYLDFRFPDSHWRDGRPALAAWYESFAGRPSARATDFADG